MINMIVAVSKNGVIGKDGNLPWRIKEDLRKFKELTMGGVLFVGKKTAATLPPLAGRDVVGLNRDTFPTLNDVKNSAVWNNTQARWLIGGAAIYNAALENNIVDRVYLTIIDKEYDGDTFFNTASITDSSKWILSSQEVLREQDPIVTLQVWDSVK